MKRRDVIKLGSTLLGGACLASLSGCVPNEDTTTRESVNKYVTIVDNNLQITPKQTAMYEYSCPMPFSKEGIDELYEFNKTLKKGKVTTLYSSIPSPAADTIHPYFTANARGVNKDIKILNDYISYVRYAIKKDFKCVYALNSTLPITEYEKSGLYPKIIELFKNLNNVGINDVKIANPALLKLFSRKFPDMNLHLSTSSEYHSFQNYEYLLKEYPEIKSINMTTDENKNFQLLYNLRKSFPKVKLELLVNEHGCLKFCISRCYHPATTEYGFPCVEYIKKNQFLHFARNTLVFPWEWEYYSAIGINNFKFSGGPRHIIKNVKIVKEWAKLKETGVDSYLANEFMNTRCLSRRHYLKFDDSLKLSDLIKQMPDINYFIKNGSRCLSSCGINCRYCYEIAENIKKIAIEV